MMKVFAVFDTAASSYSIPQFLPSRGVAARAFADVCADPRSPMGKHPVYYSLFEIGEYDPNSGKFVNHPQPEFVSSAADVVRDMVKRKLIEEPELPGTPLPVVAGEEVKA